jgi:hypothetical protein
MQSTLKQLDDPHDVLAVASDAVPVAPTEDELAKLARSFRQPSIAEVRTPSDLPAGPSGPAVDTTFRPAAVSDIEVPRHPRSAGRRATRVVTAALLLAVCTGVAAIAWRSYGDAAEQIIAPWLPQRVLAALLPPDRLPPQAPAVPAAAEAAAADPAPQQSAPAAQTTPQGIAPTAAEPSADSAQSLQSMAHDLASVGQQIEQLKASIEELKAGQQQMSRDIAKASEAKASEAKASEQSLRPKSSTPPPRPVAARTRKPMPPYSPPQAAAAPPLPQTAAPYVPRPPEPQPQASDQPPLDPELASVPRPPMPVR